MSRSFQLRYFVSHWLNAVDEHSLHSPFFYDFYTRVVRKREPAAAYLHIESHRKKLLRDKQIIKVEDFGAGSNHLKSTERRICDIARTSLSPPAFSRIYHRLIQYANASTIIELGTSFGINTLYLAKEKNTRVYTFEGASGIAMVAKAVIGSANMTNIQIIEGNIDKTLPAFLTRTIRPDVVIMDANHRYVPTLHYFNGILPYLHNKSIVVIDDIYSSVEMKKAWDEIRKHKLVYGSADLFRCGFVFFDPSLNKQNVVLQH